MSTCFLNDIYCCYLPTHCSHGLQPLNNGVSNAYISPGEAPWRGKALWKGEVRWLRWMCLRGLVAVRAVATLDLCREEGEATVTTPFTAVSNNAPSITAVVTTTTGAIDINGSATSSSSTKRTRKPIPFNTPSYPNGDGAPPAPVETKTTSVPVSVSARISQLL